MADEAEKPAENLEAPEAVPAAQTPVSEVAETQSVSDAPDAIGLPAIVEAAPSVEASPVAEAAPVDLTPALAFPKAKAGRKPKPMPALEETPPAVVNAPKAKIAEATAALPKFIKARATKSVAARKPKRVAPPKAKPAAPKLPKKLASTVAVKPTPKVIRTKSEVSPTLSKLKDKTMVKTSTTDFTAPFKTAFSDIQEKAKTAYEKSTVALGEANDFAKGNVEALVESSKILASGLQELGSTLVAEGRSSFETLTSDVKELAAIKSPTDFFQLHTALFRRNFDTAVAYSSKNSEAMLKLANEAFSPISSRVSLAVEKVSAAA